MKICVTAQAGTLESQVDPRFGRCAFFIIVDPDTKEFEAVNNSQTVAAGGAGIQSGQLMAQKGVTAVLTGNIGPNASQVLQAAGIQTFTGVSGTVEEAVENFKKGVFKSAKGPTVGPHFGMKGDD